WWSWNEKQPEWLTESVLRKIPPDMIPDKKLANVIAKSKEGVGLMNSGKI
ncbi:hypothetical protein TeGR_g7503, partial [Tetraparma gracilis]